MPVELGVEAAEFHALMGDPLDEEQSEFLVEAMSRDGEGQWCHPTVADIEARQNGKGETAQARFGYGAAVLGERILWTAHEVPTATDAHRRLAESVEGCPDVDGLVSSIKWGAGAQCVEFKSGGGVYYRTRSDKAGRGLPKISAVVVDEAQHLSRSHLAAAFPTMAVAAHAQRWFGASGGFASSEVLWDMRLAHIKGDGGSMLFREVTAERWEIDPDSGEVTFIAPDPEDRANWYRANIALRFGRMTEQFLEDQLVTLGAHLFSQEHLCVWDPIPVKGGRRQSKLSLASWMGAVDPLSEVRSGLVFAVAVGWQLDRASVAAGGRRGDGARHVELVKQADGVDWLPTFLTSAILKNRPKLVAYDAGGPSRALKADLEAVCETTGVKLVGLSGADYGAACELFPEAVRSRSVFHLGDEVLPGVLQSATVQPLGKLWVWGWNTSNDVSPLAAMTVADWCAKGLPVRKSAYEDGAGLLVV